MSADHDPVLESIEARQFSSASNYIRAKRKKSPSVLYYQVLEIYLNYCQGQYQDSVQNCIKLFKSLNNDPRCTDLIYKMLVGQGKHSESNEVYEAVLKRYPNSHDLLMQWMNNAIKYQSLKSLQKSTFHLAKLHKEPKYKYWSALANYLLAKTTEDAKQRQLFVSLGYKLIEELAPNTTHELYVHVLLLNEIDKAKSVDLIDSFSSPLDLDMKIVYLRTLDSLEKYDSLLTVTQRLLFDEKFNDFNTWKLYIKASLKTGVVFEDVTGSIAEYKWSRNSQLALVEAAHQYGHEKFMHYVLEYYDKLKTKLCCFSDIKHYFVPENAAVFDSLVAKIEETTQKALQDVSTANLNILVNNQKLLQLFGRMGDAFEVLNWEVYKKFLALCKTKLETDFYVANELVLINVISSLHHDFSIQNIYKQIMVLEYLVSNDSLDYKVNLWLMKLYKYVGLIPQMQKVFNKLKIKMVQYDSLGFLAINNISCLLPTRESSSFLELVYRFYLSCEMDLQENIIRAFEEQVYNKVPHFLEFGTKISNSFQNFEVVLEINKIVKSTADMRYRSFFAAKLQSYENRLSATTLTDNRDLLIFYKYFSFTEEFVSELEAKFTEPYDQHAYLRACYLQESLINEFSDATFKKFNKVSSGLKLPKFEAWVLKVYTSLFKLQLKNLNENEFKSCINYLTKNLKLQKLPLPQTLVSKDLNYQAITILNLIKYIDGLSFNKNFKDIIPLNRSLAQSFDTKLAKDQLAELTAVHEAVRGSSYALDIPTDQIDALFNRFHRTLELCSYKSFS